HHLAFLDGGYAADVRAYRRIELQGAAASGGLRIAEHDADLFADLIDEDETRIRFGHMAGELAHGLRHEPRLYAHMAVAHFAIELGFGDQRGDGVDHQH